MSAEAEKWKTKLDCGQRQGAAVNKLSWDT